MMNEIVCVIAMSLMGFVGIYIGWRISNAFTLTAVIYDAEFEKWKSKVRKVGREI
jgi:hypothetical protein